MFADPADGIDSQDDTTFYNVSQGTEVTFGARFYNDFCQNKTDDDLVLDTQITVLGDGSLLSSKLVRVIIPYIGP